jgi:hypothetical protein
MYIRRLGHANIDGYNTQANLFSSCDSTRTPSVVKKS